MLAPLLASREVSLPRQFRQAAADPPDHGAPGSWPGLDGILSRKLAGFAYPADNWYAHEPLRSRHEQSCEPQSCEPRCEPQSNAWCQLAGATAIAVKDCFSKAGSIDVAPPSDAALAG